MKLAAVTFFYPVIIKLNVLFGLLDKDRWVYIVRWRIILNVYECPNLICLMLNFGGKCLDFSKLWSNPPNLPQLICNIHILIWAYGISVATGESWSPRLPVDRIFFSNSFLYSPYSYCTPLQTYWWRNCLLFIFISITFPILLDGMKWWKYGWDLGLMQNRNLYCTYSMKFWYVAPDTLCYLHVRFDVHPFADNTKIKLIYASIATKLSRHLVIWQRIWIFIIKIICQWSGDAFQQTPGVP